MDELDKLEEYLKNNDYEYKRIDETVNSYLNRHQIIVYENGKRSWDAICHIGSYGYEEGLLEVMGDKVLPKGCKDAVCGYLTAQDIIDMLEGNGD